MNTALIIHGTPDREEYFSNECTSPSNSHWIPWLQKQLLMAGYDTQTPEMPEAYAPDFVKWQTTFERYILSSNSLLIGHSCGGGFLLRWLSEHAIVVKRVVLVAPWLDPFGLKCPEFFEFQIDPRMLARTDVQILYSDNDSEEITASVEKIRAALPAVSAQLFKGYGHFCLADMRQHDFPELLRIVLEGR
jgi:uncharacterized protein